MSARRFNTQSNGETGRPYAATAKSGEALRDPPFGLGGAEVIGSGAAGFAVGAIIGGIWGFSVGALVAICLVEARSAVGAGRR